MKTVLSIAGFDPSSGAGITSDIKTFENHQVYGLGVCTAITVQNDISFERVSWTNLALILDQLRILFDRFDIGFVKIGIIENLQILSEVINFLKAKNPHICIVWDPIIKSSTGFVFQEKDQAHRLSALLNNCTLITPNFDEWSAWFLPIENEIKTNVLIKGGHREGANVMDELRTKEGVFFFEKKRLKNSKHGTGCVLSSSILAQLALGNNLNMACEKAGNYIHQFINSNDSLLGQHVQ